MNTRTTEAASVSVVIPCYNAAPFLRETLDSILSQSIPPLEVIVVDDGSKDDSSAIAASYGDPVRVIRQENSGESVARNQGIEASSGQWIAFLDADDVWKPTKLEQQLALTHQPDVVCVHTGFYMFGDIASEPEVDPLILAGDYRAKTLICRPLVNTSTALVRADVAPRFPTWTQRGEDMIFFTELSLKGGFAYVPERLAGYRRHGGAQTFHQHANLITEHFESRHLWVRDYASVSDSQRQEMLRAIVDDLVATAELARWRRDWKRYWELRDFLTSHPHVEAKSIEAFTAERIWPPIAYQLKDRIDNLRGALFSR